MPTIAQFRDFTDAGGLLCYGPKMTDAYRLKGLYTGRILNGEKSAELPIVQPTKLDRAFIHDVLLVDDIDHLLSLVGVDGPVGHQQRRHEPLTRSACWGRLR